MVTHALTVSPNLPTHPVHPCSFHIHSLFLLLYFAMMLRVFFPFPPSSFSSFTTQYFHHLVQEVALQHPARLTAGSFRWPHVNLDTLQREHTGLISASRQSASFLSYFLLQAECLAWGLAKSQEQLNCCLLFE